MSGEVLSAEAIAALVDAAKDGRIADETRPQSRHRRMRALDFSRPSKFTAEQERRLKRAMESFCRTASTRLSAELRVPLELELLTTSQLTWANAHAQVPSPSIAAVTLVQPTGTRVLLTTEQSLVIGVIELLLGGTTSSGLRDRRLTDIDWALTRYFHERVLSQLSLIWQDMADVTLAIDSLDLHMETAQLASVSEPTLAVTLEARLEGSSATMALLLPWASVASVVGSFASRDDFTAARGEEEVRSLRHAIGGVDMPVRAEVAAREMPIEAVLALRPGDTLRLGGCVEDGILLYADEVPVHRARPGRSGTRRAAQVTARVEGGRP